MTGSDAQRPKPLIIIGLDGASFNILDPLMQQGQLPNLNRLCAEGLRTVLNSTIPAATLPAWTSFLTAASPSVHGIVDLWMRQPNSTHLMPAQGQLRAVPTFLQMLSAQGLKVACLGVPGTYPPEPQGGLCIAGFDAPGAKGATPQSVWPKSFYPRLKAMGGWRYATFNEHRHAADRQKHALSGLLHDIAHKERVILKVHAQAPWDVFMVHLQASDTAGHHLWHTFDATSPRHRPQVDAALADAVPQVYRRLDTLIGKLLQQAHKDARVLVVSDHGMGGADSVAIHLNRLLAQMGLLHFAPRRQRRLRRWSGQAVQAGLSRLPHGALGQALRVVPRTWLGALVAGARGMAIDWQTTGAFSFELDYAPAIWLHGPALSPNATRARLDAITEALLALRHPRSNKPLVARVYRRDELAPGPRRHRFADLTLVLAWPDGFRPSCLLSDGPGDVVTCLPKSLWAAPKGAGMPGVHRSDGILLLSGPDVPHTTMPALDIAQGGALVYALMDQPLPAFADGALPALWGQFLRAHSHMQAAADPTLAPQPRPTSTYAGPETLMDPVYGTADAGGLVARLQALGYMG